MTAMRGETTAAASSTTERRPMSNLAQRALTVLIGGPVALLLVFAGGWAFAAGVIVLAALGAAEFYLLAHGRPEQGSAWVGIPAVVLVGLAYQIGQPGWALPLLLACAIVTFALRFAVHRSSYRAARQALMTVAGVLYIGFPTGFLIAIRGLPEGLLAIGLVLTITWGADSFAYVGGRLFGRHKLAPRISPKKTVEGAITGYLGGMLPALALLAMAAHNTPQTVAIAALGPLVAIVGDLLESWMKRLFGAKDSHLRGLNIFPGHGGVLDRIDALIFVTVFCYTAWFILGVSV
jgi:phosphatidate cytidylyltransferase